PRVAGLTRASRAPINPGSVSVNGLRPPPGRRTAEVTGRPASNSWTALVTVARDPPEAWATRDTPPRPRALAFTPRTIRRWRLSRCGRIVANSWVRLSMSIATRASYART